MNKLPDHLLVGSLALLVSYHGLSTIVEGLMVVCQENAEDRRTLGLRRDAVDWEHDAQVLLRAPIRNGSKRRGKPSHSVSPGEAD